MSINICNGRNGQATSPPKIVHRLSVDKGQVLRSGNIHAIPVIWVARSLR